MMRHLFIAIALLLIPCVAWGQPMPPGGAQPLPAKGKAPPPPVITNPLVTSLLETKPTRPDDLVRVIETLIGLKHAPFAKPLLNQLLAANLDEDKLAALGRQYGSDTFARFATMPELQPEGKQVADAVLAAYSKQAHDPARMAALIARLKGANLPTRQLIYSDLRSGGSAAAVALIAALQDPARADEHDVISTALVAMESLAIGPLLGALQSPDAALQTRAIQILHRLRATAAAPYLAWPAYSPRGSPELKAAAVAALDDFVGHPIHAHEAASLAYTQAKRDYAYCIRHDDASREERDLWSWDAQANQPVMQTTTVADAALQTALWLSRDLYRWYPNSDSVRRLYLGALLESSARTAGLDQPLPSGPGTAHEQAAAAGVAGLTDLLSNSMADGHLAAATAAAQMLGDVGTSELLHDVGPRRSVLIEAARHPDRRLRFTALDAIFRLQPRVAYPGSSQALDDLALFAGASGATKTLVIDTRTQEARRLAALLAPLDYDADVATDGRIARTMLNGSGDYALVLLDCHLPRTIIDELIQQIRHDHRSADLPIALVISPDDRRPASYLAERDPLTFLLVRPQDAAGMAFQVQAIMNKVPRRISPPERLDQAKRALTHLGAIAAQQQALYDIERTGVAATAALYVPELTPLAAPLLADLGMPKGQQELIAMASRQSFTLESRRTAAEAFRRAVKRYGVLLTTVEVQGQYDRYNQSEQEPPESQEVLNSILDTIEMRAATARPAGEQPGTEPAPPQPAPPQPPPANP